MKNKIPAVIVTSFLTASLVIAAQDERPLTYRDVDILLENGRTEEAERLLSERLSRDKTDYVALTGLGDVYINKGDRKKALKFLNSVLKIAPDYPMAHFSLGRLYFLMQDTDRAISEFDAFKEKMSRLPDLDEETRYLYIHKLHYICEVYFTLKQYGAFRKEIDGILKLDPDDQAAFYNLGVYYYVYEHSRAKAYDLFKKAMALDPNTYLAKKAQYAIEYIRTNPDSRVAPDFSFIDKE